LTAWSGLPSSDTKQGLDLIRDELVEAESEGVRLLALGDTDLDARPPLRPCLLGQFDTLLLGYRTRDLILDPAFAKRVNAGGGMISSVLLADGRIVGTWKLDRSRKTARVVLEPFAGLTDAELDGFSDDIEDVARFSLQSGFEIVVTGPAAR
jgi:hypothetical protein